MSQPLSNKAASYDSGRLVPRGATLDHFSEFVALEKGIRLIDLAATTQIRLQTTNSEYVMTILDPATARVWVQGGQFLRSPTEAIVWGASLGGAFLRTGLIGIGLQLELSFEAPDGTIRKLTTSPVDHLFIERYPNSVTADIDVPEKVEPT